MARKIEIDGAKYTVTESFGYVPDVGARVVEVETPDGFKKAIKQGGRWRFWTAHDRTKPLREALARGNKEQNMSVSAQLPEDHPTMKAWRRYSESEEYANTRRWAAFPEHVDGSLWAAFLAGRESVQGESHRNGDEA